MAVEPTQQRRRRQRRRPTQVQCYMAHTVKYCGGFGYKYLYEECHDVVVEALVNLD